MDLSNHDIAFSGSGYRVIDWLHSASSTELPDGQKVLGEIGTHLSWLHHQNSPAARKYFFDIFLCSR